MLIFVYFSVYSYSSAISLMDVSIVILYFEPSICALWFFFWDNVIVGCGSLWFASGFRPVVGSFRSVRSGPLRSRFGLVRVRCRLAPGWFVRAVLVAGPLVLFWCGWFLPFLSLSPVLFGLFFCSARWLVSVLAVPVW